MKTPWHLWLVGMIALRAFPVFAVALTAFLVSLIYHYLLTSGGEILGRQMAITSVVIAALLLFFMWYSRLMAKRGVLQ